MPLLHSSLPELLQLAVIIIISISLHEFAHAWVSHKLGDPTPKLQGRVTMNPLAHIDPIGLVMLFVIGFWWGKPVEINPWYYKNKRIGELKVALAGPLTNIILASIWVIIFLLVGKTSGANINSLVASMSINPILAFLLKFSLINIILAVFNLTPLPPLDGFTIVKTLNFSLAEKILRYQQIIFIIFILLVLATPFGNIFMTVGYKIFSFLFTIFGSLIY